MKRLTRQAVEDIQSFELEDSCCSCHVHPPCSHCVHPGNTEMSEQPTEDVEPIYWQHIESDSVGFVLTHEEALDMLVPDTYISKELFVQRIREGWSYD